jgi:hypothetical protein
VGAIAHRYSETLLTVVDAHGNGDTSWIKLIGKQAACFGDSGAGLFLSQKHGLSKQTDVLAGVVTRSDLTRITYAVPLTDRSLRSWATSWASERGIEICGLSADDAGCRVAKPSPPSLELFTAPLDPPERL